MLFKSQGYFTSYSFFLQLKQSGKFAPFGEWCMIWLSSRAKGLLAFYAFQFTPLFLLEYHCYIFAIWLELIFYYSNFIFFVVIKKYVYNYINPKWQYLITFAYNAMFQHSLYMYFYFIICSCSSLRLQL